MYLFIPGYYIFAEANGHENRVTRLTSQRIPTNLYCIRLSYHMAGYTVGMLTLRAQFFDRHQTEVLFSKRGIQGDEWHKSDIEFQARTPFQVTMDFCRKHTVDHFFSILITHNWSYCFSKSLWPAVLILK